MLPKKGDILIVDIETSLAPAFTTRAGGLAISGTKEIVPEGTLVAFQKSKGDVAVVKYAALTPKVRKLLRNLNKDYNCVTSYAVDPHALSFHCKKEDYKPEMMLDA